MLGENFDCIVDDGLGWFRFEPGVSPDPDPKINQPGIKRSEFVRAVPIGGVPQHGICGCISSCQQNPEIVVKIPDDFEDRRADSVTD